MDRVRSLPHALVDLLRTARAIVAMEIHNGWWIGGPRSWRAIRTGDLPTESCALPCATGGGGYAFMLVPDGSVWRWDHETGGCAFVADDLGCVPRACGGRLAAAYRR